MKKLLLRLLTGLYSLSFFAQATPPRTETPIKTVDRIFKEYVKFNDSDSDDNKSKMEKSFLAVKDNCRPVDLELLINVWMYYDPTDFKTRELIEPIFFKYKKASLDAVKKRLNHKRKSEAVDMAPYTDLLNLKNRLTR
jgi:hypothetical protein